MKPLPLPTPEHLRSAARMKNGSPAPWSRTGPAAAGCGIQKGTSEKYRGVPVDTTLLPKIKVEVIVSKISVDAVVEAAKKALYTGHIGDGKIFVYNVTRVVKIRTGEEDFAALQDVE